jgi:hypothetical protein
MYRFAFVPVPLMPGPALLASITFVQKEGPTLILVWTSLEQMRDFKLNISCSEHA